MAARRSTVGRVVLWVLVGAYGLGALAVGIVGILAKAGAQ